jgi:beta-glucosidase/6-phospho-beta-glucosidase/beta-galactosidase
MTAPKPPAAHAFPADFVWGAATSALQPEGPATLKDSALGYRKFPQQQQALRTSRCAELEGV